MTARARTAALSAAAAALGACFLLLCLNASRRTSASFDESFNILSGWEFSRSGRLPDGQPNPPLLLRLLALPLPAEGLAPPDVEACLAAPRSCGYRFVYSNSVPPDVLLGRARAVCMAQGLLLVLLCGLWAYGLGGAAAALPALALAAFMPPLLALSSAAGADIGNALLCTAALYLFWRASVSGKVLPAAAAGLFCGLAPAGKYTAVLLLPLGAFYVLYDGGVGRGRKFIWWSLAAAAALAAACLPVTPWKWLSGGLAVARELEAGHVTYLLGNVSREGSWYYFPLALLIKTPLPALVLGAAGLRVLPSRREDMLYLLLPAAAWLALGLAAKTQVGIRHLLPVYPLLCVWAGFAAGELWRSGGALRRALTAGLLLWQAAAAVAASPWQLSYFNELAGGTAGGYRYLLDSNLDWGQGLRELSAYARAKGADHIYLSYFGCGDPHAYGLKYSPVLMTSCAPLPGDGPPPPEGRQLLAVSATNRMGVYYTPRTLFSWLDGMVPERIAGGSIWVYDVTGNARALKLLSYPGLSQ
ncbi:MAG: hypothetical protein M0025_03890 [Elusimicrobia bacterium]|nr:hypothetical protein [Elusimicrobiota bacterium]